MSTMPSTDTSTGSLWKKGLPTEAGWFWLYGAVYSAEEMEFGVMKAVEVGRPDDRWMMHGYNGGMLFKKGLAGPVWHHPVAEPEDRPAT